MFKLINRIFNKSHVHCFCDKKYDIPKSENSERLVVMACNICGLEDMRIIKENRVEVK